MAHSKHARTVYRARPAARRSRTVAALVVVAAIAASVGYELFASSSSAGVASTDGVRNERPRRDRMLTGVWPAYGQAALQIGQWPVHAGPDQHPAPIASLAKVMTAYLMLRDHPL